MYIATSKLSSLFFFESFPYRLTLVVVKSLSRLINSRMNISLGHFVDTLYFQLFLWTPYIDKREKLHCSPQKSKPSPRACLEDKSLDQ